MTGIIFFLIATFVVSVIGLIIYLKTLRWVAQYIEKVPDVSIFILFLIYGLTIFLSSNSAIFGWSGMSSVLMLFLVFVAPWLMLIIAIDSFVRRKKSIVHRYLFYISVGYIVGLLVLFVLTAGSSYF